MLHIRRYLASLAVVVTLLAAYAFGVAPLLEPPPIVHRPNPASLPDVNPADPTAELLARLFPPDAWERQNPKIVETDACTLLVKDYKPTPDGMLELTPCTLIFHAAAAEGTSERRPIVMQAPRGAFIQFDKALDIAKAQFGRLVKGHLPGQITIFSPETSPGAGDDLHLVTHDLQMDKQRVYTTREVEFRYGESHGRGRDLTIALAPKDPEDPQSSIGGVRSLTLAKIDRLHIEAPGGSLAGLGSSAKSDEQAAPLEVTCRGPFVFDVLAETAMFDDGVVVERVNLTGPPDSLTCQRLLLVFADDPDADGGDRRPRGGSAGASPSRASPSQAAPSEASPSQAAGDPLAGRLKRIVAEGGPVRLVAPSSATVASAARIEYSLAQRRLILTPGAGAEQVSLKQQANEFTARELDYEAAEQGRLGRLWAAGPGQLTFTQAAGLAKQTIVAKWEKELRVRPHERNQVISLIEKASLDVDPLGHFDAEELHLWVLEVPREAEVRNGEAREGEAREGEAREGEAPAEPGAAKAAQKPAERAYTILPDRLLASGGVTLDSPRLHVDTARLEVWFKNLPPKPEPLPPVKEPRSKALTSGQGVAPGDVHQPNTPTNGRGFESVAPAAHLQAAGLAQPRRAAPAIRPPSLQKFDLTGDLIQMQVVRQGEVMELEDLMIRGHVSLDESRTAEPGQKPIRIRGDSLELRGGVTGPGKIDIVGGPAEVGGRGMSLMGGEIHLLRSENRLWIDGPGEAKFPAAAGLSLPGAGIRETRVGSRETGVGSPAKPADEINVVWQDRFTFDGLAAEMSGEVQARTATQVINAQRLEATLSRRLDFAMPAGASDGDLARLVLDGGVHFVGRTLDEHGEQTAYDEAQVKNLVVDRTAGTLHADGPGWMRSHRVASAGGPGVPLLGARPMPPMGPVDPHAPPKLNYIHVEFQGAIAGLIERRQIEFQRQVRTIFAPVSDWHEQVVATKLDDLGDQGILMTSDKLTVVEMNPPGQKPWIEAFVTGNAIVEGKRFTAHAPRIEYTSDKQLLILRGDGRADAQLWYREGPGHPESSSAAQKWEYWLDTGKFKAEGIGPTTIQTPPGGLRPR